MRFKIMRQILFRGFNRKNNKWLYGYYLINRGQHFICPEGIQNPLASWEDFAVEEESVGQWTGVKDKDGKGIYEGDVIGGSNGSINCREWTFKRVIRWDENRQEFNTPLWRHMDRTHYYNVIGNIYENKELLEDEE